MNNPAAYTPLESLFLFQSLLTHGLDTEAFARTSESLRNNALVKSDKSFDAARLAPDALQQLFLLLLRDEVKGETGRAETTADGSTSPASRKRNMGSPPLPSLREAYAHIDKVPVLVDRLYARYRDTVVKQVREDERRVSIIQKDIAMLEKNEKERLAKAAATQNGTPTLAPRDGRPGQPPTASLHQTAAAQAGGTKRPPPATTTPVYPPKPLTNPAIKPTVAPPSLLPSGTLPVRPTPSPKAETAAGFGLQAPVGMAQPGSRTLQSSSQPPRPAISPRPDAIAIASTPKDATPAPTPAPTPPPPPPSGATAVGGGLKWEKPYRPPATQSPGTPGQKQPLAPAATATNGASRAGQPQRSPQQLQQAQLAGQTPSSTIAQTRTIPVKPILAAPQNAGQQANPLQPAPPRPTGATVPPGQQQPRPISTTPVATPVRPIQTQQQQKQQQKQQQSFDAQNSPRPIAAAQQAPQRGAAGSIPPPQKWTPAHTAQQAAQQPSSLTGSPAPLSSHKGKLHASPYSTQPPKPAIPEHIIRQAAAAAAAAATATATANAATPKSNKVSPVTATPQTPGATTPTALTRGFGTKWASHSTPSTPRPITAEPESPAYEPVSPPPREASLLSDVSRTGIKRDDRGVARTDNAVPKARARPSRTIQGGRGPSTTSSVSGTRRSMSAASQADELSMDHPATATGIKHEVLTPRHIEETGDTTADESVHGRTSMATPGSVSSRLAKRKRRETPPVPPPGSSPSQVLWTRGFTKVSASALEQVSSHRDANMFATGVRERDAPNYRMIVLQPQDITSIRSAIKQGNKAALQAASSLPGGDPGTASVWLPMSPDLVPPRGIINSAQLERELVHMFCNAIMYNPDPDRGLGPSFLKRNQDEEEEVIGYHLDENGVVKNTRGMFVEVEKLLGDLRSAEKQRGAPPPPSATRQASVATPADDTAEDEDELAGDGNTTASVAKRRRIATRN